MPMYLLPLLNWPVFKKWSPVTVLPNAHQQLVSNLPAGPHFHLVLSVRSYCSYHSYADHTQLNLSSPSSDPHVTAGILACLIDISRWTETHQLKGKSQHDWATSLEMHSHAFSFPILPLSFHCLFYNLRRPLGFLISPLPSRAWLLQLLLTPWNSHGLSHTTPLVHFLPHFWLLMVIHSRYPTPMSTKTKTHQHPPTPYLSHPDLQLWLDWTNFP